MEAERGCCLQRLVEEEMHMTLCVVDKPEWRDAARLQSKPAHHTLGRGERQLAGRGLSGGGEARFQPLFEVVDVEVVVAMEADEIVFVPFMVAQEDVLAMHRAVVAPPSFRLFDGLPFRVVVALEAYVVGAQIGEHRFFSCHVVDY